MSEPGSEARSEVNAEIASVSRLMESLETRENNRVHSEDGGSMAEVNNQSSVEARGDNSPHHDNSPAACSASSHSS